MSKSIFWKNKKNISKCHLQKFLPSLNIYRKLPNTALFTLSNPPNIGIGKTETLRRYDRSFISDAFYDCDHIEGWAQDYGNSNMFLKPLFRGNLDPFVNNANLGAIAHTSNGT